MTAEEQIIKISEKKSKSFRGQMLDWYDKHRRTIPWRAPEGELSDPYYVWLSEIMCQQTTVPAVIPYFLKFIQIWPTITDLANAERDDVMKAWAGLGYYARARNLHKCAKVIAGDMNGSFPQSKAELQNLPGIGDYTSAAIAAIAFNKAETVVDGNIERVMARQFNIRTPMPKAKRQIKQAAAQFFERETARPGDFAQSLMDLGSAICTPKNPKCSLCPVVKTCAAHKHGNAEMLPVKAPKRTKPQKRGYIYWIENQHNQVLLHTRDDNQMLGGMLALPCSDWIEAEAGPSANGKGATGPAHVSFIDQSAVINTQQHITHSFTHFDLRLDIFQYSAPLCDNINDGYHWVERGDIRAENFPTVFKKAVVLCH